MNEPLILDIAGGVRIALPAEVQTISTCVFLEQEDWFEDEAPFVRAVAEAGGAMLDVGASYGFYALSYARAAGPGARAWAFEPAAEVCELVRASVAASGLANVTLLETALGSATGRARFTAAGSSELGRIDPRSGTREVKVSVLDALDAEHGFRGIDFVKLDVEGHEGAVIEGGREFFRRESPLVMLEVKAGDAIDLSAAAALETLGYALYRLVPGLGALVPFDRERIDPYLLNVFACKADRAARLCERGLLCHGDESVAPLVSLDELKPRLRAIPALSGIAAEVEGTIDRAAADDASVSLLLHGLAAADRAIALPARAAALSAAAAAAGRIAASEPGFFRALGAARVLRAWGDRRKAATLVCTLLPAVLSGAALAIDAPFLPPLAEYDGWAAPTGQWVSASVIEAAALWTSFGIYWGEPFAVPAAEILARYGRSGPRLERRRQLRAMLEGRARGPRPHELLRSRTAENLNPAIWCGC